MQEEHGPLKPATTTWRALKSWANIRRCRMIQTRAHQAWQQRLATG